MATQIISRNDTTANWGSANPILGKGELGVEFLIDGSIKTKIGDGVTRWNALTYNTIGATGATGAKGDTGTGLSRTLTTTIDFGSPTDEDQYVEKTITDALIKSSSIVFIQVLDDEYLLQGVSCKLVSIADSTSYTISAIAPEGANGIMNINILIF